MNFFTMICPECSKKIQVPENWIGREGACTNCGKKVVFTKNITSFDTTSHRKKNTENTSLKQSKSSQSFEWLKRCIGFCITMAVLILGAMLYLSDCSCSRKPDKPVKTAKERKVSDSELIGQARIMTREQVKRKLIAAKGISFSDEAHKVLDYEQDSNIQIINTRGRVTAPNAFGVYRTVRFSSTIHYNKKDKNYYLKYFSLDQ